MTEYDFYPLSKLKKLQGTRRLAREKALQIALAHVISRTDSEILFKHIFYREFNFGDEAEAEIEKDKFLRPEEIYELEADVPVVWKADTLLFGEQLVYYMIEENEYIDDLIEKYAKNWELERIAIIDRLLLTMASVEFLYFDEIPPKVSINEVLDIAKKYSTDKSKTFINGVLDSLLEQLKFDHKLNKKGRGLIND